MRTPLLRRGLFSLFLLAAVSTALFAQVGDTGAFAGVVLDENGQPLSGLRVTFRRLELDSEREVETGKDGRFFHGGFPAGRYLISVWRGGQVVWRTEADLMVGGVREFTVDLKQLREEAERRLRLDPELERQRAEEQRRQTREEQLQEHYSLGARYLREGQAEDAVREFEAAVALEPEQGTSQALLADAYVAAERPADAVAAYRRALELEPNEAAHHNNLGTLLVRSGQLEEALQHFERAARLDAARAATYHFNGGAALLNAGRAREATSHFRQALRGDPTFALAHFFLGVALYRTSPRERSVGGEERIEPQAGTVEAFQRYLQLAPDGPYAASARDYLNQLGVRPPAAPETPPPGSRD